MDSRDLARALRDDPPELDDIRRARIERNLLEEVTLQRSAPRDRRPWIAGGLALVAAVALTVWLWPRDAQTLPVSDDAPIAASFEALRDGVPVRSGTFAEGESLQTAADQLLRVRFGGQVEGAPNTLIELEPSTRVHFATLLGDAREVELERGRVRIEFHPNRRGEESLAIRTPTARIEVVGTIFEVEVDERDATIVRVQRGAVRVIPLEGETTIVRAGHSRRVGISPEIAPAATTAEVVRTDLPARPYPQGEVEAPVTDQNTDPSDELADEESETETEVPEVEPISDDARFDLAARYLEQGRRGAARHELRAIARTGRSRSARARAWTEIAQIYEAENEPSQAAESYRRAANAGGGTTVGTNALFALGRMRTSLSDTEAAKVAYRRYLDEAPDGPLARRARRALCRLGDTTQCRE